jgi:hypothetical protein
MEEGISIDDCNTLANMLGKSKRAAKPSQRSLCMEIGIGNDHDFIDTQASNFATQIVYYLNGITRFDLLVHLCDVLVDEVGSSFKGKLQSVREKLCLLDGCNKDTQPVIGESYTNGIFSLRVDQPTPEADISTPAESALDMAALEEAMQAEGSVVSTDRTDPHEPTAGISDTRLERLLALISDLFIRYLEEYLRMHPKHWRKEDLPMPDARKSHVAKYFEGVATRLLQRYDDLAKLQEDLDEANFGSLDLVAIAQNMLDEVTEEMRYLTCLFKDVPPHLMAISIEQGVHMVVNNERTVRDILRQLNLIIIRRSAISTQIQSDANVRLQTLILSIKNLRSQIQSIAVKVDGEFDHLVTILDGEGDEP